LNPLQKSSGSTLSNGNLDILMSSAQGTTFATMAFPASGKYYFECTATASQCDIGIAKAGATPPTGFLSLCTTNLLDPTIADGSTAFDAKARTGLGTSGGSVSGFNFSPDFLWEKPRNGTQNHYLMDAVRGSTKYLASNTTGSEGTNANYVTAFTSDGFTVGSSDWNTSTNVISWAWDGGDLVTTSDTTNYNQTQTWSSFGGSGIYSSTYAWTKLFDGDSTNSTIPANGSSITVDFSSLSGGGISYTSSVKVTFNRNTNGPDVTVNGSAIGATANGVETTYTLSGSGTLTSVGTLTRTAAGGGNTNLVKIVVDGKELIDPGVIPAGSLNSSAYNTSQNWTGLLSASGGSGFTNQGNGAFAGTDSAADYTYVTGANSGTNYTITLTPPSAISYTSSVVVRVEANYGEASIDGGSTWVNGGSSGVCTFSGSGSFTSIIVRDSRGQFSGEFHSVKVDGVMLVNSGATPAVNVPAIASTVRANPSAGFSIVAYNTSDNYPTIGHGLNAVPELIIAKSKTDGKRSMGCLYKNWGLR
jgi:hypothetical protein